MKLLKPCPFCGGKASMQSFKAPQGGYQTHFVRCDVCGACGFYFDDDIEARKMWNKRFEPITPGGAYVPAGGERLKRGNDDA